MREQPSQRRSPGFTLTELLIVIIIVAIAATLILPVVLNLARTRRVAGAARILQAKLHGAHSYAVAQRGLAGLRLEIVPAAEADAPSEGVGCVVVVPEDGSDTPALREVREVLPAGVKVLVYHAGDASPRAMPQRVWYEPDGTVSPALATPLRIAVVNAADETDPTDIVVRRTGIIEGLWRE